jgi:serine/threonine protein kinase
LKKEEIDQNPEAVIAAIKFVADGGAAPKPFIKISSLELTDYLNKEDPNEVFQDLEKLGEGAFGLVVKATDTRTQQAVAIKILSIPESGANYTAIVNELAVMHNLSGENSDAIVKYLGAYRSGDELWVCLQISVN